MSNKDFISIKGISGIGHHGLLEVERTNGQEFIVDVELHLPLDEAGKTDEISKTVDYGLIAILVNKHIVGQLIYKNRNHSNIQNQKAIVCLSK
jgi:FolB domain-containing protein